MGNETYDRDWFGSVPLGNYAGLAGSVPHVTYDKYKNSISMLNPDGLSNWNGAYGDRVKASFKPGLPLPIERWSIKSIPLGAKIWTDQGQMGLTNTEIDVVRTGGSFMILQMDGYVDCPKEKCTQLQVNGQTELMCKLKKAK